MQVQQRDCHRCGEGRLLPLVALNQDGGRPSHRWTCTNRECRFQLELFVSSGPTNNDGGGASIHPLKTKTRLMPHLTTHLLSPA
jgi:hypothetical protein